VVIVKKKINLLRTLLYVIGNSMGHSFGKEKSPLMGFKTHAFLVQLQAAKLILSFSLKDFL
jgi:hypothetical protein